MKLETWQRDRNERCMERHQLSIERLQMIDQEETVQDRYRPYFRMCAAFLLKLESLRRTIEDHSFETFTLEERKRWNQELYVDILGENYKKSFADPTYAVKMLSEVYGQLLSFLYTELRSGIPYAFSNRLDYLTILNELFLEIYQCFEAQEQPEYRNLRECVYWYASDYCDVFLTDHLRESINPVYTKSVIARIRKMDLSENRYLYSYGEYVGEKELETAEYFRNLSEEALWKIADTYTRKYRKEDCQAEKSVVQIFYRPGFERLVLAVLADLEKQGIEPVICIPASGVIARDELHGNVNPQYEADHKCDEALFLDKKYIERKLDVMKYGYECEKEWTARATGRIRLDRAEKELSGQAGPDAVSYTEEQKECLRIFDEKSVQLMNQYGLDITTPYEELEEISVLTKEGKNIILLEDGRFVTEGKKMPDGSFEK